MEGFGFQKMINKVWKTNSSETSYFDEIRERGLSVAAALSPPPSSSSSSSTEQPRILLTRPPTSGRVLSIWTCSKLCAFFFVAGVVVGYTLKRRVRRWAARVLRRMKDE